MTQANMHEAKSKLSQLAELAHSGKRVVIAKAGKPYVDLVPHQEDKPRVPGGYVIDMKTFDDADKDVDGMFYGDHQ
jgi:antitoxin (DNA-binding transcriptional repressor) of toxin-antitoxin stability system